LEETVSYKRTEISADEIARQQKIMGEVAEHFAGRSAKPLAFVDTYGCQQNVADSERLRGMLTRMGYDFTDSEKDADVIVINTCAVREHAEKRVLGNIGALTHTKRAKPDQIIALCGCMVQQPQMAEKIKNSFRHVDIVFGPQALWQFPEFLHRILTEKGRVFSIDDTEGSVAEGLPVSRDGNGTKAWLSIMYGCNNFCSYCIVPHVRGRERSRKPEIILDEARELVAQGYKDITLLGQNVNSYGKDLDEQVDFSDLLRMINNIPGEFRIRFMTSHPKDAGEKLFKTMAECEKVSKQLHLPFQSGNNRVLKVMNRKYTREDYLELIRLVRSYMPDIVLTSDIIVGFPGETDQEFEDTLSLIETVRFDALFTFIYSRRSGTPAAEMDDPATKEDKQRRFDKLIEVQNSISAEKHAAYVGKIYRVLIDGLSGDERYPLTSRTDGGRLVRISGDGEIGQFADVKITGSNTWALFGEIVK
jgi:tRNA-2-methylthio-N6-dimethylallyladenosine synthase